MNNFEDVEVSIGSEPVIKEKIIMAIRGDTLIYLADGKEDAMDKVKESFKKVLKVPIIEAEITEDCNIKELRENALLLNEKFKYLLD